ncbi:MAG TPA: TA system VapC family ribonuclease toxin [Vicinamibacteria bacterium]|nr:TA system VapC family ribonuclease toxin [Vicinamibacteria bacterium]
MSYSVDVNVLIYSSDESSPLHKTAANFLKACVSGGDVFCLAYLTLMSYQRITTHPGVFADPLTPQEALENVETLARLPNVRLISEQEGFLDIYREITGKFPVRGNLVPDAHLAALLRQEGVRTLYTNDPDFRRFDFLRTENPFS